MLLGNPISYSTVVQLILQTSTLVCVLQHRNGFPATPVAPVYEVEESPGLELRVTISIIVQAASTLILVAVVCCCNRSQSTRAPPVVCKSSLAGTNGSRKESVREI
eukprot:1031477-Amphidinium_carterae.1